MSNPKLDNKNRIKPWENNVPSFMVLYSVLAAVAGVLLTFVLADNSHYLTTWWIPVISLTLAIILFILSAEKITDALDENDVEKYAFLFIPYNFAVILLFLGIISVVYFRYNIEIFRWIVSRLGYVLISSKIGTVIDLTIILLIVTQKWYCDIFWLVTASDKEYCKYINELEGKKTPEFERGIFYELFTRIRKNKLDSNKPNFKNVRLELGCSKIDGVGVFAVQNFKIGEFVAEGIQVNDYESLVPWSYIHNLDRAIQEKICKFCIGTPTGFFPPDNYDFNKLSIEWFFNHSCEGNMGFNKSGDFIAIKEIDAGEELTYDYGLAESNPNFKMKCKCSSRNCRNIITGSDWKNEIFRKQNAKYMLPYLLKFSEE